MCTQISYTYNMTILNTNKHTIQLKKDANNKQSAYFDSLVKQNDKHKIF